MTAGRAPELQALGRTWITDAGVAPASVLAIAARGPEGWRYAHGASGVRSASHPEPVDETTPFDLASVTKPVVACTVARLVRRGSFGWDTPVGEVLPEARGTATGDVPVELLLSHRAGLSAHGQLYAPLLEGRAVDPSAALRAAAEWRRPECVGAPPGREGFPPVYSDLGYLLLGAVAARLESTDLATLVEQEVSSPLALDLAAAREWAERPVSFFERVAPTETVAFRGGEIIGEVHDENAWALGGAGLSGHAGLFGTAGSVARFGASVLDALAGRLPEWLAPHEIEPLVRPRPGGTLRAGFDGRSDEGSSAGSALGARAFGHLGFTGTSLWCDPDAEIVTVILTNRVSPSRDNVAIRKVRPGLNDLLFQAASALRRS